MQSLFPFKVPTTVPTLTYLSAARQIQASPQPQSKMDIKAQRMLTPGLATTVIPSLPTLLPARIH